MAKETKFRNKDIPFTMVSRHIVDDTNISVSAKGTYLIIQTYITIPNFIVYKSFIQKKTGLGRSAFERVWKELKDAGYLKQYRMRDEKNQIYYEYDLLDEPKINKNNLCDNIDTEIESESSTTFSVIREIRHTGNPSYGKQGVYNNTDNNNTDNTNTNHNQSNLSDGEKMEKDNFPVPDYLVLESDSNITPVNTSDNNTDNFEFTEEMVKEQIGYETFSEIQKDDLRGIIALMVDIFNMDDNESVTVDKRSMKARAVKGRLFKVDFRHIHYILDCIGEVQTPIRNIKAYLLTSLYNAPLTIDVYYKNRVAVDYANGLHFKNNDSDNE